MLTCIGLGWCWSSDWLATQVYKWNQLPFQRVADRSAGLVALKPHATTLWTKWVSRHRLHRDVWLGDPRDTAYCWGVILLLAQAPCFQGDLVLPHSWEAFSSCSVTSMVCSILFWRTNRALVQKTGSRIHYKKEKKKKKSKAYGLYFITQKKTKQDDSGKPLSPQMWLQATDSWVTPPFNGLQPIRSAKTIVTNATGNTFSLL